MDLETCKKLIAEVNSDISAFEAKTAQLRSLAEYLSDKIAGLKQEPSSGGLVADSSADEPPDSIPARPFPNGALRGRTQMDAAELLLLHHGTPLSTGQIARAMIQAGFNADYRVLRKSLFTGLSRHPERFRRHSAGMWEPVVYE